MTAPYYKINQKGDRTMLMLNPFLFNALNDFVEQGDRTMLMLNILYIMNRISKTMQGDRTMLMLNRSKINILFLHYILYILIFQSFIEILPADFSFLPIFLMLDIIGFLLFRLVNFFKLFQYLLELSSLYYFHV